MLKYLNTYRTNRVQILVYDTRTSFLNEPVYCITSRNLKTDKVLVRYGTKKQIESILSTYKLQEPFTL